MRALLLILILFTNCVCRLQAQSEYRILPRDFNADKTQQMMRAFLRQQVHTAMDARRNELETALKSDKALAAYQQKRRKALLQSLGKLPERTPLNPKTTGTIQQPGFTIEKILYESQPGFHVTANLYRPEGTGPFPAILHPVGHSENGKAYESYQRVNRLLAQHGFIVLCFDPIGQGERKQILDETGTPRHRGSHEHQELGVAPILLGRSLGTYMLWDGVRGIDYLCSRPDVDPSRIGCTGNSGGGNLTSYLMAFDDRIVAAAPGCFMTTHRFKNESPGPGDAEQNLYGQIGAGFDHPDYILTRAPRPTLILAATKDFVPIEGTWDAYRQAKRVYTQLGYPERVDLIEANDKHGFSQRLREGAVRFFARWLQGRQLEVFETDDTPMLTDQELQVTPQGQVLSLKNERSLFDLFTNYEQQLAENRPPLTRKLIRQVTGIRHLKVLPDPGIRLLDSKEASISPQCLIITPEPGISLPALYWPDGKATPVLIASSSGMNSSVKSAQQLNAQGHPVLVVEVRDTGETKTRIWRFPGADYYIAHMLGRCWLAMQAEDLLISARWLQSQNKDKSVELQTEGELGPAALHAATLEPALISELKLKESLNSWHELMTSRNAFHHLHMAVQNGLTYYDLTDLDTLRSKK
ncbi:alpha/beta hydrolase family protein [Gimesia algae]|uniref:Acetyl xylan esterase (AXE1) n=1 Tax=Gimesia algae TaxID=2527971 RepID=A0A517VF64_9PLAN|nr:acetylxylan esterase [Gimesia algae]QDT91660.1 Acetyl xylan esterase (AXE1) [Gimesia algae]